MSAQDIVMQNGSTNQCNGAFFDSGGDVADYDSDENLTFTICPDVPNMLTVLEFSSFDIAENDDDVMTVYDGDSVNPDNLIGAYAGNLTNNPELANISATNDNPSGCLTIVFNSDTTNYGSGWEAQISCVDACPEITLGIDSVTPTNFDGENYLVCFGNLLTFDAKANLDFGNPNLITYEWDFDNGDTGNGEIATTTYDEPGFYFASLTASYSDCSSVNIVLNIQVGTVPEIELNSEVSEICAGEIVELTAETSTESLTYLCGIPESNDIALPDDIGTPHSTSIFVDCFTSDQKVIEGSDIINVCLNIEHSFLGDLEIKLIAPNGAEVILKPFGNFANEDFYLGEATEGPSQGVGYEYCFTETADVLLVDGVTTEVPNTEIPGETKPAIVAGDYLPSESFDNLIGATLNGNWTLEITDNIPQDSGWLFEWSLNFDIEIVPSDNVFEPQIVEEGWVGFEDEGSVIEVTKTTEGELCYDYKVVDSFGCIHIESICIDYLAMPFIDSIEDLYQCGGDSDEDNVFNLSINNSNILGAQDPSLSLITYHHTQEDADTGDNPIMSINNYTPESTPEVVYVRMDLLENECFLTDLFNLIGDTSIGAVEDLKSCNTEGQETFDLTQQNNLIYGSEQNFFNHNITFHNTEANADFGVDPISNPSNYTVNTAVETIWIRIENIANTSCSASTSFDVILSEQPEIINSLDISKCSEPNLTYDLTQNDATALGVSMSINPVITYYNTQSDADANSNPIANPENYQNVSSPEVIWVRIENQANTDCYDISSFQIQVINSALMNLSPSPLMVCDDDNDGISNNFVLTSKDIEIGFDNPNVLISYHLTETDAENDIDALSSPYSNIVQSVQTIYFRIEDTDSGCIHTSSLELQVMDSPLLTQIVEPLTDCDDDDDGFLSFDLTQVEIEVLGSLDTTSIDLSYHLTQTDAQNNTNAIPQPAGFQNTTNPQTIWIASFDNSNDLGCSDVESFEIAVESLPIINNAEPFEICDDETGGDLSDEIATFDLNDLIDEITDGNSALNVEFFETPNDLANNNPITSIESFENTSNPQTIQVRVTSGTSSCGVDSSFTLSVNPIPTLATELEPLMFCDPDNDGYAEFDLDAIIPDILNNEPDVTITFHLTQAVANLGTDPIDTSEPYGTTNLSQQTLYVRAENTGPNGDEGTGCYDTRALELIVVTSPEIESIEDINNCDDESLNGFTSFDLTQNTPLALGDQDDTQVNITYHETQQDAEDDLNPIALPSLYTNISNPQIIYVRIENIETSCVDIYDLANDPNNSFVLSVEALPVVNTPSVLEVCDDDANQNPFPQATFDLTLKEAEISGQAFTPGNYEFAYYENLIDFENDSNAITNPTEYVNTSQPQSIYIKVIDTSTEKACFDSTVMTISVLPLPSPSEIGLDELRLTGCDDDNDGVAINPFDLSISGNFISGSETVSIRYYISEYGAQNQDADDEINTPTAYVNEPSYNITDEVGNPTNIQLIYARVDSDVAGNFCFVVVPFQIVVEPAPELNLNGDPFAYTLCEDSDINPGISTLYEFQDITDNLWDLTNGSSDELIPLLNPNTSPAQDINNFDVSYYLSEQDAQDDNNVLSPGYETTDGDVLFIRVTNIATSCFNSGAIGHVQMVVEPVPSISDEELVNFEICANELSTPGSGIVDLTAQDEYIYPDLPPNTIVVYYEGIENYNNVNPISDPANFQTSQSPQTIIAEVVNTETLCQSIRFVSFDVIVHPLLGDIGGFDGVAICVDEFDDIIENDNSPPVLDTGLTSSNFSFVWEFNDELLPDTTPSLVATASGTYTVTVTNANNGCIAYSSATIQEVNVPEFNVDVLTASFSQNHVVEVNTIQGDGSFEFQLDDGEWIGLSEGQATMVFNDVLPGMHIINGRDESGCGEIAISFSMIDYPQFFTPNQDGFNETWNITSLANQSDAKIFIFDRYGKLLKELSPSGEGWDGNLNGKPMPKQDYWFRVEFTEPSTGNLTTFKANFTLKR